MTRRSTILVLAVLLLTLIPIQSYAARDEWWDSDWTRRATVLIDNSVGDPVTDYQLPINVTYDADMQADFDDLRFTWWNLTEDTTAAIDCWLEDKIDSSWAYFWFEVPSLAPQNYTSSNTTVYLYYGNAGAATVSDGDNTFIFFDHFPGASLDLAKWTVIQGAVTVSGSELILTGTTGTRGIIDSQTAFGFPVQVHSRVKWNNAHGNNQVHFASLRDVSTPSWNDYIDVFQYGGANKVYFRNYDGTQTQTTGIVLSTPTSYHTYKIRWESGKATFFQDTTQKVQHVTNVPSANLGVFYYEADQNGDIDYVDWVFVRKYNDPEPSVLGLGSEEVLGNYPPTCGEFSALVTILPRSPADEGEIYLSADDQDGIAFLSHVTGSFIIEVSTVSWNITNMSASPTVVEVSDAHNRISDLNVTRSNANATGARYDLFFLLHDNATEDVVVSSGTILVFDTVLASSNCTDTSWWETGNKRIFAWLLFLIGGVTLACSVIAVMAMRRRR